MTDRGSLDESLFNSVLRLTQLNYISDLRLPAHRPLIKGALKKIEPKSFALEEWQAFAQYLNDDIKEFASAVEIWQYLCR